MGPETTSRTSAASRREHRSAFTLTELIVVIAVIALLAGILVPVVMRARGEARRKRIEGDLQAIRTALTAYKADFGDYPRIPVYPAPPSTPSGATPGQPIPDSGAATMGKAVFSPYGDGLLPDFVTPDPADPPIFQNISYKAGEVVKTPGPTPKFWVSLVDNPPGAGFTATPPTWTYFDPRDGADGPGFRLHGTQGRLYGPYIQLEKFKISGTYLFDIAGHPILYFPLRSGKLNLALTVVDSLGATRGAYVDQSDVSLVNARDNFEAFRHSPSGAADSDQIVLARIRMMLGDYNTDGIINNGETPISGDFILWSAGADGLFGPQKSSSFNPPSGVSSGTQIDDNRKAVEDCDDVTNLK